jgi:hypothetical protein
LPAATAATFAHVPSGSGRAAARYRADFARGNGGDIAHVPNANHPSTRRLACRERVG